MAEMDDVREFHEIQELFDLMVDLPSEEREQLLNVRGVGGATRRRLATMLEGAELPEMDAAGVAAATHVGQRVGGFRLVQLLGAGGMGAVYLADRVGQGEPRRVAVKLMAPHAAGPDFVRRFEREQHNLAELDHPHIARLIESGISPEGAPYLAMEYVAGEHIDRYCDAQRLGVRERIGLLAQVCDAVSYAHRNLILHLDIKPSNILVTREGSVKLLDFGTSRLIAGDSLLTTAAMATPAYASPEQLRNDSLTTACDVYSLGAVLYTLLCGRRPVEDTSIIALMERVFREEEPAPLEDGITEDAAALRGATATRLRQVLRGDLSTIAARCLRSLPGQRYATVDALADDLRRYLDGREVLARPQTTTYRLSKFARRNVKALAATIAVMLVVAGTLGYAAWRQHQAVIQGERAQQMQSFLYDLFRIANSNYTGKPAATVPEFLELGVKILPDFIHDPDDLRHAQLALGESMLHDGALAPAERTLLSVRDQAKASGDSSSQAEADAFDGPLEARLGHMEQALAISQEALDLTERKVPIPALRVWAELGYAEVRENGGVPSDRSLQLLRDAVDTARRKKLSDRIVGAAQYALASDLEIRGQLDEADRLIRDDLAIYLREPYAACDQSKMYGDLGFIAGARGDVAASVPLFRKAYDGALACAGPDNNSTLVIEDFLAGAMLHSGDAPGAVRVMRDALPRWKKLGSGGTDLSNALFYTASALLANHELAEAETTARELIENVYRFSPPGSHTVGSCEKTLAEILIAEGKDEEALAHARTADTVLTATANSPAFQAQAQKMHVERLALEARLGDKGAP
ncbi:serine/threonine protein kinase [Bryocella elongata]|uniref:Serine/threonine protein kinase n=1 Tax=Bryocella elongata TaxID=863522 RepID=A0A1H6AU76_9BACT|nr:serine/threonine-protein kinase [Bryocella elongata]SEG52188.1 serine/threonine protein kinase [Bryocella elongata]